MITVQQLMTSENFRHFPGSWGQMMQFVIQTV